ncbi:MAG TPA: DinB family protein [Vicinamibacteria bacterium]|jgi:uncharacterized damage-inducible protein DinB
MDTLQFCIERRKAERPAFVNVLKAVPQGRLDYRPDPRSRTAVDLAWLIAMEEGCLVTLIEKGSIEWKEPPPPATVAEIVAHYERSAALVDERLARLDGSAWEKTAAMLITGAPAWEAPLREHVWGFFFDAIHHRGQLTTYLRPMGAKVPSIYGPSGDDPGQ